MPFDLTPYVKERIKNGFTPNPKSNYLLWVDLETGGLDSFLPEVGMFGTQYYPILEVSIQVTDYGLNPLGPMETYVVKLTESELSRCSSFAEQMHRSSGLWDECLQARDDIVVVDSLLDAYCEKYVPKPKKARYKNLVIAGSSIAFDRDYAQAQLPKLAKRLHYQLHDVSQLRNLLLALDSKNLERLGQGRLAHRTQADIEDSMLLHDKMIPFINPIGAKP